MLNIRNVIVQTLNRKAMPVIENSIKKTLNDIK